MNAWATSVLLLLSATDAERGLPARSNDEVRSRNPCEADWSRRAPPLRHGCERGGRAGHATVCRACFRD